MKANRRQFIGWAGLLAAGAATAARGQAEKPAAKPPEIPTGTRIDGYRGIWFTLGQKSAGGDKYSGGLGTYTANHVPIAIHVPSQDKTFFVYGGTVKGQRHLLIMASYFDHKTGRVPRPVVVCDKRGVDDPHDNAAISLDGDGRLWVFVSGRAKKRPGFIYRSQKPFDVSAFDLVRTCEITYPQPRWFEGSGFFHLFTKYTKGRELYFATSADGRTWTDDTKLAGFGGHYQVSAVHGRRIGTYFNYHPGGNVDKRTNLYYAETPDLGKTWTTVDGRPLELPLREVANPALVINYEAEGKLAYGHDIAFDAKGRPALFHETGRTWEPGEAGGPREWRVTRWTGRGWETATLGTVDHNYDMGSLYIDGDDWRVIGPSEPGPQPWGCGGELALWRSADGGVAWKRERVITRGSARNNAYPRRPVPWKDPFCAFWADGNPGELSESHLYFCNSDGTRVWSLPYDMDGADAEPVEITPK